MSYKTTTIIDAVNLDDVDVLEERCGTGSDCHHIESGRTECSADSTAGHNAGELVECPVPQQHCPLVNGLSPVHRGVRRVAGRQSFRSCE